MKALASLLYKFAMSNDVVDRNRAVTLYTGKEEKGTRPAFTMQELKQIMSSDEPYAEYVVCMCYLGYRPSEMLNLTKESYDPINKCLRGGSKTKAGINRIVTIPPAIQPIIDKQYDQPTNILFPRLHDGQKMTDAYFRRRCFDPLMQKLGITNRMPYSCRHTYANLLKGVKGSDTDKASLIGHADASMTKYYQSADYESLRAITDNLAVPV